MTDLIPVYIFYIVKMLWYDEMDKALARDFPQDTVQDSMCPDSLAYTGCHSEYEIKHWYDGTNHPDTVNVEMVNDSRN
jgi:hypothetical protein